MTLRGIALAAALLASMPVEAAACHRYSRWYYPWPQRCGILRPMRPIASPHQNEMREQREQAEQSFEIPLPSLARADVDGGEADEPTRARLLLRVALEAAYAR